MQKDKKKSNQYLLSHVQPLLDPLIHALLQLRPQRPFPFLLSYFGASVSSDQHLVREIVPRRRERLVCRCLRQQVSGCQEAQEKSQQQESLGVIGLYENILFKQFTRQSLKSLISRATRQNYSAASKIFTTDDEGAVLLISGSLRETFSSHKIIHKAPKLIGSEELVFRITQQEQQGRQLFVLVQSRVLRISRNNFSRSAREQQEFIEKMSKKALSKANRTRKNENQEVFLSDPNLLYLVVQGSLKLYQSADLDVRFRDQIQPGECLLPSKGHKVVGYEALLLVIQLNQ